MNVALLDQALYVTAAGLLIVALTNYAIRTRRVLSEWAAWIVLFSVLMNLIDAAHTLTRFDLLLTQGSILDLVEANANSEVGRRSLATMRETMERPRELLSLATSIGYLFCAVSIAVVLQYAVIRQLRAAPTVKLAELIEDVKAEEEATHAHAMENGG